MASTHRWYASVHHYWLEVGNRLQRRRAACELRRARHLTPVFM